MLNYQRVPLPNIPIAPAAKHRSMATKSVARSANVRTELLRASFFIVLGGVAMVIFP